jgi:hypothetical protein
VRDPLELLAAVEAATLETPDARFKDVRLDYFGERGRLSLKQLVLVAHPDRVRIQTYIPGFDGVAGVLVCACGQFAYHDRREDVYYYGVATAQNVGRVMPVGLNCQDLVHVLLGGAPHRRLRAAGGTASVRWDRATGRYDLRVDGRDGVDSDASFSLQIRHGDWRVAALELHHDRKVQYRFTADRFETVAGRVLPRRMRFIIPKSDEDFSLTIGETEVDPDLPEVLWELAPPSGTPVERVGIRTPLPADGRLCRDVSEEGG